MLNFQRYDLRNAKPHSRTHYRTHQLHIAVCPNIPVESSQNGPDLKNRLLLRKSSLVPMPNLPIICKRPKIYALLLLFLLSQTLPSYAKVKFPVVYLTDLFHPYNDPDDHFDLAALYSVDQFDLKGVIIDNTVHSKAPGIIPVRQMNRITGKNVPVYVGLRSELRSPDDTGMDQQANQEGCLAILDILKNSRKKVTIITAGSLRDVAAAYNRDPELFSRKLDRLIIFAGEAENTSFLEYNVALDKNAYIRVMNSVKNIYWVPCFDSGPMKNKGLASFWQSRHSDLLKGASPAVTNYFLYALSRSPDTLGYLSELNHPVDQSQLNQYITGSNVPVRYLWCCSVFPWFTKNRDFDFPFTFEPVTVVADPKAAVHYTDSGNKVMRFKITDLTHYSERMTTIFNTLIRKL